MGPLVWLLEVTCSFFLGSWSVVHGWCSLCHTCSSSPDLSPLNCERAGDCPTKPVLTQSPFIMLLIPVCWSRGQNSCPATLVFLRKPSKSISCPLQLDSFALNPEAVKSLGRQSERWSFRRCFPWRLMTERYSSQV